MSALGGKSDVGRALDMLNGYRETCIVVAAIQVGLFDAIAKEAKTEAELTSELAVHGPSLVRLVRALVVSGLVTQDGERIALTRRGKMFLREGFGIRDWADLVAHEYLLAWANLGHSVKTGDNAFEHVFATTAWEHRRKQPALDASFNRVTSAVQVRTLSALLAKWDFSAARTIVDVGGGHGNLVKGVLASHAQAKGIVFDQPHVVAGLTGDERVAIVGGSFLESVPPGGDVYLLKHVLHNWDDDACVTILRNCAAAMGESAALLVLENVLPERVDESAAEVVMLDVHMMAVLGGRERTEGEYAALFARAGLALVRCMPTKPGAPHIVEARRSA